VVATTKSSPRPAPMGGTRGTATLDLRSAPMPKCSGIGARVLRNHCPGIIGMVARVPPESLPEFFRNMHTECGITALEFPWKKPLKINEFCAFSSSAGIHQGPDDE